MRAGRHGPGGAGVNEMFKQNRGLIFGLLVVLGVLMAGASGSCGNDNSAECLIFCS
jgi:hypothetical protein